MQWHLQNTYDTSAGRVAAGSVGKGPPLVLSHGWPWSSFAWHRIIPDLASSFTVYWYDMPGYGQSHMAVDKKTSLDVQGQVFVDMIANWGLDRPTVIAHDYGGATTLRAHLLHGVDFNRYVLMNVVAMRPWGSAFFEHVGRHIDAFLGLPPNIHEAVVFAYIRSALAHDIAQDDIQALASPWLSDVGRVSFYQQFAQADERYTLEVENAFSNIRCPTTILWGSDDPWIPLERGKALADIVQPEEFKVLTGLGHLPQLEDSKRVLQALSSGALSPTR